MEQQRRCKKTKSRWKNVHFYSSCHNRTKFNFNIEWWYFSRWQLSRLPRNFFDYYIFGSREQPCIRPFSIWVKNFPSGKIPIYSISGNNSNGWYFFWRTRVYSGFSQNGIRRPSGRRAATKYSEKIVVNTRYVNEKRTIRYMYAI